MASGGTLLSGAGKRLLDATGRQILDDSCVPCCCYYQTARVVIAGTSICSCPIANLQGCGSPPVAGLCNNMAPFFIGPSTFCPSYGGNGGDQLCVYSFGGTIDGTYYLTKQGTTISGGLVYCTYQLNQNPSPITCNAATFNGINFVCNNPPLIPQKIQFGVSLMLVSTDPGVPPSSAYVVAAGLMTDSVYDYLWDMTLFNGSISGDVCGTLCPKDNSVSNSNSCQWGANAILPVHGGTATWSFQ